MDVVERSKGLQLVSAQRRLRLTGGDPNLVRAAAPRLGLMSLAPGVVRQQVVETISGLPKPVQLPAPAGRCLGHPVGSARRGRGGRRGRDRLGVGSDAPRRRRGGPAGDRGRVPPVRVATGVRRWGSGRTAIGLQRRAEGLDPLRQRLGFDQAVPRAQGRDERPIDRRLVPLGPSLG